MANITVIPATKKVHSKLPFNSHSKRRVAGYARVSTDHEEQLTSYDAQVKYYTRFIQSNPEWEFVGVYTDEGISALNTKHRDGFNRMIEDALSGKIDLIITKSVSRFARNTVDSLTTIRKLKEHGTEVFFEKENIYTFDGKGELLLTLMSSLAQEESRSISENVTWGQRKRFADGKINLPYKQFLGYQKGPNGFPQIVPKEAELVRRIYDLFMTGHGFSGIAKILTDEGIPTPAGKEQWASSTIRSILTNEKYKGDALLQKSFTIDFLSKKKKRNEGEIQQYYVEHSHEAIISPTFFDCVQKEIQRRKSLKGKYCSSSYFSCRIKCGDCGSYFGPKIWNSNSKYRRTIWQCNQKFKNDHRCTTPHLTEEMIQDSFLKAYSAVLADRERILEDCRLIQTTLSDCSEIDAQMDDITRQLEDNTVLIRNLVSANAAEALDQEAYLRRYDRLVAQYNELQAKYDHLAIKRSERMQKADDLGGFMFKLNERDTVLDHFDPRLWSEVVECATVYASNKIVFRFKNGSEFEVDF